MAGNNLASPGLVNRWAGSPRWMAPAVGLTTAVVLLATTALLLVYPDRIVPGVRVLGLDLGGQTPLAARALLEANAFQLGQQLVTLKSGTRDWQVAAAELGVRVDTDAMVQQAYEIGGVGNPAERLMARWSALLFGTRLGTPVLEFDREQQEAVLARIAAEIYRQPVDARIDVRIAENGRVDVVAIPAADGTRLLVAESAQRIREAIFRGLPAEVQLAFALESPTLTTRRIEPVRSRAERMVEAPVTLALGNKSWLLSPQEVAATLTFERAAPDQIQLVVDEAALDRALARIHSQVGQPAANARFDWNGGNLRAIREGRSGAGIDVAALARSFEEHLGAGERSIELPLTTTQPLVAAADGPRLGIKELVQEGRTAFSGATAEKQHNIRLAAANVHGTVVPPGEIFSFNREVGPTTLDAGYRTGWGITLANQQARTIPSVAGGICQVATTLFQPVFHAGYAIEQRQPHLYWIQSYGQPPLGMKGLDATVDEDSGLDFQFINNTPEYLLIQARVEGTNLIFGLYGTKPTWDVKIEGPSISNVVPADRTAVRQLEPTMPAGRSLQVEAAQDGFEVTVVRTVTSGDQVRRLPLRSRYLPARNVILHGPQPAPRPEAAAAPAPDASESSAPAATPDAAQEIVPGGR